MPYDLKIYHDRKKRAAVVLYIDENDEVQAQGVVGDDIVIRPIPPRVLKKVKRESPNIPKEDDFQSDHVTHHVIIRSAKANVPNIDMSNVPYNFARDASGFTYSNDGRSSEVDTVYPQLLLAVDYSTYLMHGLSDRKLAVYMAALWNGVDLRFREMSNPKVRLNIAALYIPTHPKISFMGNHPEYRCEGKTNALNINQTLASAGKYFRYGASIPNSPNDYDLAVAITNRDLCGTNETGHFTGTWAGLAYVRGACNKYNYAAAALVLDKGGFGGLLTAAHEIAHSLGSPHDGKESLTIPGGTLCEWNDGYIMSYVRNTSNLIHMSHCTKRAIRLFATSENAACLRNKPDVGWRYVKTLPGKLFTREQQCREHYNFSAYKGYDYAKVNDCLMLYCQYGNSYGEEPITMYREPAEGSPCGYDKICLDGKCVYDQRF